MCHRFLCDRKSSFQQKTLQHVILLCYCTTEGEALLSFGSEDFNWTLIIVVLTASAVVAYVGDVVGMKMGKKRITLFNLRPRYTSKLITLFTGLAISSVTLFFASLASDTVRGALFSINYLQRQVTDLTFELQSNRKELSEMGAKVIQGQKELDVVEAEMEQATHTLQKTSQQLSDLKKQSKELQLNKNKLEEEVLALRKQKETIEKSVETLRSEAEKLRRGLQQLKEGRIVVSSGELMSQAVVTAQPDSSQIQSAFDELVNKAQEVLAARLGKKTGSVAVVLDKDSAKKTEKKLTRSGERNVLRLVAKSNSIEGQPIQGEIRIYASRRIYEEGDLLAKQKIPPGLQQGEAGDILYTLLRAINKKAVQKGVLPDPISGNVGNLDSALFFDAVAQMLRVDKEVEVRIEAERDIYSEGPVFIKVHVGK